MGIKQKSEYIKGRLLYKIIDNTDSIQLYLDKDEIVEFIAEGECCSDSWIESVESPSKPEKIISMEEIKIPPSYEENDTKKRDPNEMDSVNLYFYRINTENGSYLIEMRNNSNGYYGGYLV